MTPYGVTECLTSGPGLTCLHDITCVPLFTQYVRRMDLQMFAYHRTSLSLDTDYGGGDGYY